MKIVDYFESTPAVRATSNSQGKNIVEKPIFIDNEMNEKDVRPIGTIQKGEEAQHPQTEDFKLPCIG